MNEKLYCKECRSRLGLDHLTGAPSEDYIKGAVAAFSAAIRDEPVGVVIGRCMRLFKGHANAETVARIVLESRTPTTEERTLTCTQNANAKSPVGAN